MVDTKPDLCNILSAHKDVTKSHVGLQNKTVYDVMVGLPHKMCILGGFAADLVVERK